MNRADRQEAADMPRAILAAVDRGEVSGADGPVGVAVVRRLQGALLAIQAMEDDRGGHNRAADGTTSGGGELASDSSGDA